MSLSIDYDKIKQSYNNKKLLSKLVVGTALCLTLSPLILKDKLNNHAKLLLATSGFIFSLCSVKLPSIDYEEKLIKTYKETGLKQYKTVLQGEIVSHQSELEIVNQQKLANIIEKLPTYQVPYFAAKYGVIPLIAKNYIDDNSQSEESVETPILNAPKSIFETTIERAENETNSNLDWMKKAINNSCFLAGKKRSGKTFLMKWLLKAYIANCKDTDIFYISDPHYDDVDFDDCWVSKEIDKKLIQNGRLVKSENTTLKMINDVINAGEIRKKQGLTVKKGVGKIRLFMDEIDSFSQDIQEEISIGIKKIEYEYAKYNITCVLGSHSLKKSEMGIDSSVTSSMINILFPSVVLDRNTVLSGSFPTLPTIKRMIDKYKTDSLPNDGRLIIITDDSDVYISHVPNLNNVIVQVENEQSQTSVDNEENPVLKIKKWCDLCFESYQRYPSRELIKKAWIDFTGNELSDKGLDFLIDKLKDFDIKIP